MAIIRDFKDLKAWQESRALTRTIYEYSRTTSIQKDWGLKDQIQRAAVSVMSNVAEGFERGGQAERLQFFNIARASCAEVRSLLCVCEDVGYLSASQCLALEKSCVQINLLITGLMKVVKEHHAAKPST